MNIKYSILDSFYLDLRALALFRIGLGSILIYDLLLRVTDLSLHYTDNGILPIKLVTENLWEPGYFSIHALSGTFEWQLILFIIAGFAALSLLLGYKTKLSIFLCFVFLLSLHNRNPWILNSGDTYLRLLLFWSMFLPIGQYYSIDKLTSKKQYDVKHSSLASFCLITQIIILYVMTGLLKTSPEWLKDGTAIYYALSLDQFAKPLGTFLLDFPSLLKIMTHSVIILEVIFPFLFIMPIYTNNFRTIALIAFGTFHISLGLTMALGLFVPVCLIALLPLIPTPYLNKAERYIKQSRIASFISGYLSKKESKALEDGQHKSTTLQSTITNFTLTILISIVLVWNLSPLLFNKNILNNTIKKATYLLRLDQKWSMFAPSVLKRDEWVIIKAELKNGETIDLLHGNKPVWKKPTDLQKYQISERWRKYFRNLYQYDKETFYKTLSKTLLQTLGNNHKTGIESVEISYLAEYTPPPQRKATIKKERVYKNKKRSHYKEGP